MMSLQPSGYAIASELPFRHIVLHTAPPRRRRCTSRWAFDRTARSHRTQRQSVSVANGSRAVSEAFKEKRASRAAAKDAQPVANIASPP
jgi:hypothetical protein